MKWPLVVGESNPHKYSAQAVCFPLHHHPKESLTEATLKQLIEGVGVICFQKTIHADPFHC